MSYRAIAWAYDLPLKGAQKPVLVALADMADEANSCYPGQAKLAHMAGVSVATVRRALDRLEAQGLISRQRRTDAFGHRTSDRYHLHTSVTVLESLPLNLPSGHSAHTAESQSLPLNASIPTAQRARGTTRRTTRENHQTDISTVSPVTNVLKVVTNATADDLMEQAQQVGIRWLGDVQQQLSATVGHPVSPFEALVFAEELGKLALEPVENLGGFVATACRETPEKVREYFAGADLGVA